MEDEEDYSAEKTLSAGELKEIFKGSNIKLFYFDACETAEASEMEPSLAGHIYRAIPSACVIANILRVKDTSAIEATRHIYETLFTGPLGAAVDKSRMKSGDEWWKPVLFGRPDMRLFDLKDARPKERRRLLLRPPETARNYVYRYGIVRQASELIEKTNHLVLHGIGGAGKSTLANYLSQFYDARFDHVLFFDFKDMGITRPGLLLDEMLHVLMKHGFMEYEGVEALNKPNMPPRLLEAQKWGLVRKTLNGPLLLILDNLEDTMQDQRGLVRHEWKDFVRDLLNDKAVFTIFTSRLKIRLTDRDFLGNLLEIGEYTEAEAGSLYRGMDEREREYFGGHYPEIVGAVGLHPLSVSKAVEKRFADVKMLFGLEEFKGYLEFYRTYFERYKQDAGRLFSLGFPVSDIFMENLLSADFVSLIRDSLLILQPSEYGSSPYKVISAYFSKDFGLAEEALKALGDDIQKAYKAEKFETFDLICIFTLLLRCRDAVREEDEKEEIVNTLAAMTGLIGEARLHFYLPAASLDVFTEAVNASAFADADKAMTLNNLGVLYSDAGRMDKAEEAYDEALNLHKVLMDFTGQFNLYPHLINVTAKTTPVNYRLLANRFCGFLELFDALSGDNESAPASLAHFIRAKTFAGLDLAALKEEAGGHPLCVERASKFLDLLNTLSAELDKDLSDASEAG
jgi:tetratricopeptide (TPR) repeat protein